MIQFSDIEQRMRNYERRKEQQDQLVFWGLIVVVGILFALGWL